MSRSASIALGLFRATKNELAMLSENALQAHRKFVLKVLQFAIGSGVVFIRFGGFTGIQFDELIGDVTNGDVLTLLLTTAPQGLQSCTISGAFGDFQRDDFGVENIGHDLTPDFGLRAA